MPAGTAIPAVTYTISGDDAVGGLSPSILEELEASVMTEPKAMTGLAKSDWSQNSYRYAYICQPGPLYVSEIQTVFGDHTCLTRLGTITIEFAIRCICYAMHTS